MNIGLDARTMTVLRPRGTGRNLLDLFRRVPLLRPDWRFILYHQRPLSVADRARPDAPWQLPNVELRQIDLPGDRLDAWFQLRLPYAARRDQLDLLHLPANAAPAWCPVPSVVTIHDLIPLTLPGELSPRATRAFRRGIVRAVHNATRIITVSRATRDVLRREFDVPEARMTVIPWAPDARMLAAATAPLTAAERRRIQVRYNLGPRWLVNFSGSTRRKNATGVLAGFAQVAPQVRGDLQVVLLGCEPEAYRAELVARAEQLGIGAGCRILGFIPHDDLPALLRASAGLLMPSRGEGFGLPILDAFACGVPVLTSNVSSMPEVADDAAVYCDPDDAGSIAAGIAKLLEPSVATRLVEAGRRRLALFDWERTAAAVCAVYEQCLARSPVSEPLAAASCEECLR